MFRWLRNLISPRQRVDTAAFFNAYRGLMARYDAAQTSDENRRHWANADSLSANAANSPSVRRTLRNRARYEKANNCYANGMLRTLAYHCVGTGPILQVRTGNRQTDKQIERQWNLWARRVQLAAKLRTMREARACDGEAFALLTTNSRLNHPVKLSLRLIEADQIASPDATLLVGDTKNRIDGIRFDAEGNPTVYEQLAQHPGELGFDPSAKPEELPAENVIHLFREDRPGQRRGIPEITPALPLYAILRRYTLATLSSAEIAALLALFLKTNSSAIDPAEVDAWASLEINRGAMTTLPDGWDVSQLRAEQPATTYDAFTRAVIREIARCLDMPFNVAAGDSSDYNYASGRLDHQTYRRAIEIDRESIATLALDPIFSAWLDEALLVPGLFQGLTSLSNMTVDWHWTPFEHVDPQKESNSAATKLANGLASLPTYYAEQGLDWEDELAKQAEALGMPLKEYQTRLAVKLLGDGKSSSSQNSPTPSEIAAAIQDLRDIVEELASAA